MPVYLNDILRSHDDEARYRDLARAAVAECIRAIAAQLAPDVAELNTILERKGLLDRDVLAVASNERTQDERWHAAARLAETRFRMPIARQRFAVFRPALLEAIHKERDEWRREDAFSAMRRLAEPEIFGAIRDSRRVHERIYVGRRALRGPIVPYRDLPVWDYFAWLHAQVNNRLMNLLVPGWRERERRNGQARAAYSLDEARDAAPSDADGRGAHRDAADALLHDALLAMIERATPAQRDVLTLLLDGDTTQQAAERLGISYSTARVHLHNARKRLTKK